MKQFITFFTLFCLPIFSLAELVLEVDFSKDRAIWGVRKPTPATLGFGGDAMFMKVAEENVQPVAAYTEFGPVVLEDGQSLRLTVQVASAHSEPRPRDIRLALGYAENPVTGLGSTVTVPVSGYFLALPSGGASNNPRISWIDNEGGDVNFFNRATHNIGNPRLMGNVSIERNWITVVFEISREGEQLSFSGSIGGIEFAALPQASGDYIIKDFQFNTLGLACVFGANHQVAFRNLKLEWIK